MGGLHSIYDLYVFRLSLSINLILIILNRHSYITTSVDYINSRFRICNPSIHPSTHPSISHVCPTTVDAAVFPRGKSTRPTSRLVRRCANSGTQPMCYVLRTTLLGPALSIVALPSVWEEFPGSINNLCPYCMSHLYLVMFNPHVQM